jgi:hypothetical protein
MVKSILISLLPFLLLSACKAKSTFKAAPQSGELTPPGTRTESANGVPAGVEKGVEAGKVPESNDSGIQTKEFDLGTFRPKLDLVWMEDGNLSHITDGGKSLSSNFKSFLESLRGRSDIRVIFVGGGSLTSRVAKQDPNAKDLVTFFDYHVSQAGALALFAAGVCPPEQTAVKTDDPWNLNSNAPVRSGKLCGRQLNVEIIKRLKSGQTVADRTSQVDFYNHSDFSNPGFLRSVLRADARTVIVNVSPSNQGLYQYFPQYGKVEEPVSPTNFFEVTGLDKDNITYHNFNKMREGAYGLCLGLGVGSPATVDRNILPEQTGGKVFDICLPDHKPSFAELSKNVLEVSRSSFKLAPSGKVKIVKVMLGSKLLSAADYVLKGTTLSLKNVTALTVQDKLIVTFSTN